MLCRFRFSVILSHLENDIRLRNTLYRIESGQRLFEYDHNGSIFNDYRSVEFKVDEQEYQNSLPDNGELATVTVFDFKGTTGMEKELDLKSSILSNNKISWQSQTCICDLGDLCNTGNYLIFSSFWMINLAATLCIFNFR